jgi:hypothetical protein
MHAYNGHDISNNWPGMQNALSLRSKALMATENFQNTAISPSETLKCTVSHLRTRLY